MDCAGCHHPIGADHASQSASKPRDTTQKYSREFGVGLLLGVLCTNRVGSGRSLSANPPARRHTRVGQRHAYLMALHFDQVVGAGAMSVEPSGNVRFTVEVMNLPGPILAVTAEAL